jgi:Zn-dependent protease
LAILIVSLTIHEAAHAWMANRLGDPTARNLGRLSLNPIVHIDPIGTLLMPLLSAFSPIPLLGWAKPVPVDLRWLRHPRRDFMFIAAAGPISNLLQAFVLAAVFRLLYPVNATDLVPAVLKYAVEMNLMLAFFNLIPVPPLDGGNVLAGLVPESAARVLDQVRQFGFIALYALMLSGVLSELIMPPTDFLLRLLVL